MITVSNSVIIILAKVGRNGDPIETSTVFLSCTLVKRDLTSKETNLYPSSNSLRGRLLICETAFHNFS